MPHKSPFNYIGNKYRIINELLSIFPDNIHTFVDMFCGGGDVFINTSAEHKIANDVNYHLIDIMREFQNQDAENIFQYIDTTIREWGLNKTDRDAYIRFREHYNDAPIPLDLFILVCFTFNHQLRFNSNHQFNNPFGKDRSSFNASTRRNLTYFLEAIQNVQLASEDFRNVNLAQLGENDFVYADPPYTLTCGPYNDGKRGFNGWSLNDDLDLTGILDNLNDNGVRFALSNVIHHKGKAHPFLLEWAADKGYTVHRPTVSYNNSNYQVIDKENESQEVIITNLPHNG